MAAKKRRRANEQRQAIGNRRVVNPPTDLKGRKTPKAGTSFHEQDMKRRLGGFTGAGEHSVKQPGGRHGGKGYTNG